MKRTYLLLFSIIIVSCTSEKEIESCFKLYQKSLLEREGTTAVACLDENTIEYFEKILEHIKYSDKSTVLNQNYANMYIILQARNKFNYDTINNFSVNTFLATAISEGMIGEESLRKLEFVEVSEIRNNKAKAIIKVKNTNKAFVFIFNKESEKWKMSLTPVIKMTMRSLNFFHLQMGNEITIENFIIELIKSSNSGNIKANIWEPTTIRID